MKDSLYGIYFRNLRCDSNAIAEVGFEVYKHQMLEREEKTLITRLMQNVERLIRAKLEDRKYNSFLTTRQTRKRIIENENDKKTKEEEKFIEKRARAVVYKNELKSLSSQQDNSEEEDNIQKKHPKVRIFVDTWKKITA